MPKNESGARVFWSSVRMPIGADRGGENHEPQILMSLLGVGGRHSAWPLAAENAYTGAYYAASPGAH